MAQAKATALAMKLDVARLGAAGPRRPRVGGLGVRVAHAPARGHAAVEEVLHDFHLRPSGPGPHAIRCRPLLAPMQAPAPGGCGLNERARDRSLRAAHSAWRYQ